ncbi:hypothetical protein KUTeg_014962 [Tegillarca granosa]|uniref:Uncharacterized protein n=1 Tax=Tegillarca granosa TaxID=220873 RepID=A0ABQ9ENR0_TEGGR|nr:hypothetical protein KUTeg_014962 [Tegillarca granosa]
MEGKGDVRPDNELEFEQQDAPNVSDVIVTLSELDVLKIAQAVKNLVIDDLRDTVTVRAVNDTFEMKLSAALSGFEAEINNLKSDNVSLKSENDELKKVNSELQNSIDALEQYSRRNSIRIAGIPEKSDEKIDEIVLDIAKRANVDIDQRVIDRSHRIGPPRGGTNRQILVKFTSHRPKYSLMKARKDWNKPQCRDSVLRSIYVNEDLTKKRSKLYSIARSYVKQKRCTKAWSWDGKVFVTDLSNNKRRIDSIDDLLVFGPITDSQTSIKFSSAGVIAKDVRQRLSFRQGDG